MKHLILLTLSIFSFSCGDVVYYECEDGKRRCYFDMMQEWTPGPDNSGMWLTIQDCSEREETCGIVRGVPMCMECFEGTLNCNGDFVQQCQNGKWVNIQRCNSDQSCLVIGDRGICRDI